MSEIWRINQLQQVDTQLLDLIKRFKANRADDAHLKKLKAESDSVRELKAHYDNAKKSLEQKNSEVAALKERIQKLNLKLYSGSTTSTKELKAMQKELQSCKDKLNIAENDIIDLMDFIETHEQELKDKLSALKTLERDTRQRQAALDREAERIQAEHAKAKALRQKLLPTIPASLLKRYETIRNAKGGLGLAHVENRRCGACKITLTDHQIHEVREAAIAYCPSCGRILFFAKR